MTTALYRRYRPQDFSEVIGQEHVTEPLMQALRSGRIGHAYLFSGPRGCGKTTSARILARCLNCEQGPTPTPCGVCDSCRALATGGPGSVDVIEIDAASHGGVDDARDLREKAAYGPAQSRFKVYIIDEAHMVTPQGFNALLKIVEEPPEHVKFVFATTEPDKVIGTIRSRTHHYPFRLVPPARLQDYLEELCTREGVAVEPGVLSFVVRAGGGSVRDSLSVLDQLIAGSDEAGLTYAGAAALLGFTEGELLDATVDAIAAGDGAGVFRQVDRVIETGQDPRRFVEDLLERFRDLIVLAAVSQSTDAEAEISAVLRGLPEDQITRMRQQAGAFGPGQLSYAADIVNAGLTEMTGATSPRLQLELLCARLLLPTGAGEQGYAARLDRLERRLDVGGGIAAPIPAQQPGPDVPVGETVSGEASPQARPVGAPERGADERGADDPASRGSGAPAGWREQGGRGRGGRGGDPRAGAEGAAAGTRGSGGPGASPAAGPGGEGAPADTRPDQGVETIGAPAGGSGAVPTPGSGADSTSPEGAPSRPAAGPRISGGGRDVPPREDAGDAPRGSNAEAPRAGRAQGPVAGAEQAGVRGGREAAPAGPVRHQEGAGAGAGPGRGGEAQGAESESAGRPAGPRGGVDTDMIRRNWPDVLQRIFGIRRVTWTFLSEHAQVLDYDGSRLLIGLSTSGLATTFRNGPHSEVVRQALSEALGIDTRVEGIPASDAPAVLARRGGGAPGVPAGGAAGGPTGGPAGGRGGARGADAGAPAQGGAPGRGRPGDRAGGSAPGREGRGADAGRGAATGETIGAPPGEARGDAPRQASAGRRGDAGPGRPARGATGGSAGGGVPWSDDDRPPPSDDDAPPPEDYPPEESYPEDPGPAFPARGRGEGSVGGSGGSAPSGRAGNDAGAAGPGADGGDPSGSASGGAAGMRHRRPSTQGGAAGAATREGADGARSGETIGAAPDDGGEHCHVHPGAAQAREAIRAARRHGHHADAPHGAPTPTRSFDDDISVDDEDIADASAVGQPVIADVLGGVVIAEEEG